MAPPPCAVCGSCIGHTIDCELARSITKHSQRQLRRRAPLLAPAQASTHAVDPVAPVLDPDGELLAALLDPDAPLTPSERDQLRSFFNGETDDEP